MTNSKSKILKNFLQCLINGSVFFLEIKWQINSKEIGDFSFSYFLLTYSTFYLNDYLPTCQEKCSLCFSSFFHFPNGQFRNNSDQYFSFCISFSSIITQLTTLIIFTLHSGIICDCNNIRRFIGSYTLIKKIKICRTILIAHACVCVMVTFSLFA